MRSIGLLLAVVLCGAPRPAALVAQDAGSIFGRVVEAATGDPVAGAEVRVPLLEVRILTNDSGWFLVPVVPFGEYTVEVARIGFATQSRVALAAVEPATLEFRLVPEVIPLRGVVVAIDRQQPSPQKLVLDRPGSSQVTASTVDLLRRLVGPGVFRGSGQPGGAASVQLRGPTSISESQDPLVVIDGIISSVGALNDVNALDIASVEVLKGAAAAAEYGSRGRAGVIVVTTKRGKR